MPIFTKSNTVRDKSGIYFNTPSAFARENLLYLEMYGDFTCDEQYVVERNGFDSYLLMLTFAGSGTLETGGTVQSCGKDTMAVVDCNCPHRYYANGRWQFCWLHFNGKPAGALIGRLLERRGCVMPVNLAAPEAALFQALATKGAGHTIESEIAASAQLHTVLAGLITAEEQATPQQTRLTTQLLSYIDAHYREPFSIEEAARQLGVSASTLSHLFKQETGFSPYDFFINRRINQAKYLLKVTARPVSEIAEAVGYQSTANFITQFGRRTGQTPALFRKNQQSI